MAQKMFTFLAISALSLSSLMAQPEEVVVEKPDAKTFKLESNLMAAQLDSLMVLHVFKYNKSTLPKNYDSAFVPQFADSIFEKRMAILDAKTPLDLDYNPLVRSYIDMYTVRKREQVCRMLSLGQYYFPMFEKSLDKYNMPLELKYLAVVESALNPLAKSRVGARGLWQFMYETGKIMGLQANSYVDERSDPQKSTEAACQYMMRLYKMFGDWNLVLAAYNSGPGNVNKAIRRSGGKKNYWQLRPFLPKETAGYVPAFIAAVYTMTYAKEHNLYPKLEIPNFYDVDTVLVREQISFEQLSKWIGVDAELVAFLNPSYKFGIIPNVPGQKNYLVLPHKYMGLYLDNEDSLFTFAAAEFKETKNEMPILSTTTTEAKTVHRVNKGESLGLIANKYNVSVSQIKSWNHLKSNTITPGQRLTINAPAPTKTASTENVATANTTKSGNTTYYTVQPGDTLFSIANRYPGLTPATIAEWNDINPNKITVGMKLVVQKGTTAN